MHRFVLLLGIATLAVAADAADTTSTVAPWLQIVLGLLGTALTVATGYVVKWLNAKAKTELEEASKAGQEAKTVLEARVKAAVYTIVATLTDTELPKIAAMIASGEVTNKEAVKARLHALGDRAIEEVKTTFANECDVIAEVGLPVIERWVRESANALNPFKGNDTATALINGGADALLKLISGDGVDKMRKLLEDRRS